LIKELMTNRKT